MKTLGNKPYKVEYLKDVVAIEIPALAKSARELIIRAINERLTIDPLSFGKPLRYNLQGYRSLRISKYRIIYCIEVETHTVVIHAIHHRKDAYDD